MRVWPSDRVGKAVDVCVWQEDVEGYWAANCGIHYCVQKLISMV